MVLMVVIVTGPSHRQYSGLAALSWCEKSYRINLTTIRCCWVRTSGDVVRLHVVVDEGDALADATTSCRGSVPAGEMRTIGGSAAGGVVGTVDGPAAGGLASEPLPQADAAAASAPVTNEERIFRRQ
jgi:hypothetical protein